MLKVLSAAFLLVLLAGVVWVFDPFAGDDERPPPMSAGEVSVGPADDSEIVAVWESANARELLDPDGHTIEFTTTRDEFRVEFGCAFEIPGDLRVYLSADGRGLESAEWCAEPRANHHVNKGGSVILGGPGKHTVTLRALHKDGSRYVPADGTIEINLGIIDHVEGWVGG